MPRKAAIDTGYTIHCGRRARLAHRRAVLNCGDWPSGRTPILPLRHFLSPPTSTHLHTRWPGQGTRRGLHDCPAHPAQPSHSTKSFRPQRFPAKLTRPQVFAELTPQGPPLCHSVTPLCQVVTLDLDNRPAVLHHWGHERLAGPLGPRGHYGHHYGPSRTNQGNNQAACGS